MLKVHQNRRHHHTGVLVLGVLNPTPKKAKKVLQRQDGGVRQKAVDKNANKKSRSKKRKNKAKEWRTSPRKTDKGDRSAEPTGDSAYLVVTAMCSVRLARLKDLDRGRTAGTYDILTCQKGEVIEHGEEVEAGSETDRLRR